MKKLLILLMILSSFVFAQDRRSYSYAHVYKSEPIYDYRYERVYEECQDNYYDNRYRSNDSYIEDNSIGIDTIIGATLGVAIGNQIGKGNGNDVAKVAGGILGAVIANNTRDQRIYDNSNYYKSRNYNDCDRHYTQRRTKVLTGYKNYFTYEGRTYTKVTKRPKDTIRVTKTISF